MRALKDNHFNNSFSLHHQDKAREVSLDLDRDSREVVLADSLEIPEVAQVEALEVSQAVVLVASREVLVVDRAAILKCQPDRPLALLHKCNNYPLASHSKVPVV